MFDLCIGSTSCIGDSTERVSGYARALASEFKSRNFKVWFGTDDTPIGTLIRSENMDAINECKVCILFIDEKDNWLLELSKALGQYVTRLQNEGCDIKLIYLVMDIQNVAESIGLSDYKFILKNPWISILEPVDIKALADKVIGYLEFDVN